MKNKILIALLLVSVWSVSSLAKLGDEFGFGVIIGAPSAVTAKYMMTPSAAFDVGIAFSVSDYFLIYGDYLYHFVDAFGKGSRFASQLTPYVGVGGIVVVTNSTRSDDDKFFGKNSGAFGVGVRIPVGLEWRPSKPTLGIFLEVAPGLSIIPKTTGFFQGGVGARYYF